MRRTSGAWARSVVLLIAAWSGSAASEVILDGSLGGARGPLPGPDFEIGAEFGRRVGSNLFHSFGVFNINSPESATFSGSNSIDNILGRVTGGSASMINGLLRSTIPEANLFFLNPAGVVFGPNATLDVQGSFHVSTADYLKLTDGTRFDALPSSNDALLTTAPPEAFGFLGPNPAPISVEGSFLQVPEGKILSLVGGDIKIADGSLYAPGGRIDMASVASPGEVLPNAADLGVASFERLGRIEVSHASSKRPVNAIGNVDASGEGGGRIFIRGGELMADNAFLFADTRGGEDGQGMDIEVTGQVTMRNGARITTETLGSGSGGDLTVEAERLEVLGSAQISASTFGSGQGGNLLVEADRMLLSGSGVGISGAVPSGLFTTAAVPGSNGDAGDLTVRAGSLEVLGGAQIGAGTFGSGQGGNLLVEADRMLLSGSGVGISGALSSGLFTAAVPGSNGDAGNLTVRAGSLEVREGAIISASANSTGRGGNLTITATDIVLGDESVIRARSTMTGLDTENDPEAGRSGNIFITARDSLLLFNDSMVSVETEQANAGDIILNVGTLLHLRDQSSITTSVAGGTGDGGNINIDPVFTVLDGDSRITAEAREGRGGNIRIVSDFFFGPLQNVSASSERGIAGVVEIDSPETDLNAGLVPLPANFFDAAQVLMRPCAERSGADVIRLVVRPYEVLPASPYALRVQRPKAPPGASGRERGERGMATPAPLALGCLDGD